MVAFVCCEAKTQVNVGRGAICLARIQVGSTWIQRCCQALVFPKHRFYVDEASEPARIHLDPEVGLCVCEHDSFICLGCCVTTRVFTCRIFALTEKVVRVCVRLSKQASSISVYLRTVIIPEKDPNQSVDWPQTGHRRNRPS